MTSAPQPLENKHFPNFSLFIVLRQQTLNLCPNKILTIIPSLILTNLIVLSSHPTKK